MSPVVYVFAGYFFTQLIFWGYAWAKRKRPNILEMVLLMIPGVTLAYIVMSFLDS